MKYPLITTIFLLCSLAAVTSCWGQDSTTVTPHAEFGIRSDQMGYYNSHGTISSNRPYLQAEHRSRFEFYGLRLGARNNLIRFTLGYQREHAISNQEWSNPLFPDVQDENTSETSRITTSIALGHHYAPFKGEFSSRIFFRAGLSLNYSYVLSSQSTFKRSFTDSSATSPSFNQTVNRSSGEQHLQFRAFAQAGVKLWKGLTLSLEWQVGPGIHFGTIHLTRVQSAFQQNQPADVTIVDRKIPMPIVLDIENMTGAPFLALGWRF